MSQQKRSAMRHEDFDPSIKQEQRRNLFSATAAQAKAALESCEYRELVAQLEEALKDETDFEQRVILSCLLNEALCELSRYREAVDLLAHYEAELSALPEKLQAQLLLRVGATCRWNGQFPKAVSRLTESVRIFAMLGDEEGSTYGYYELAQLYLKINEPSIARDYLVRAYESAEALNNNRMTAAALLLLGIAACYDGDFAQAISNYTRAIKLAEGGKDYRLLGNLHMNLAYMLFVEERGSFDNIISLYEKALEYFKLLDNRDLIAHCYNNLGDCLLRFSRWDKAQQAIEKAIEHALLAKDSYREGLALITLGELNLCRGDLAAAKRPLTRAVEIFEQSDKSALSHAQRILGYTYKESSRSAFKIFSLSLQNALTVGDHSEIVFSMLALADYQCSRRDYKQAQEFLKQTQERLNQKPSPYISGFIQRMTGRLKAIDGQIAEAMQHINVSISIFTAVGDLYELGRSRMEAAEVLAAGGSFEKAQANMREAMEIFSDLRAQSEIERARKVEEIIEQGLRAGSIRQRESDQVSDITLFKRLAEACITSEILLQEFGAIVFELLRPSRLIIFQRGPQPSLLFVRGCASEEAARECRRLESIGFEDRRIFSNSALMNLACEGGVSLCVYFETSNGEPAVQLARLEPLLEFLKIGLEKCRLREGSAVRIQRSADAVAGCPSSFWSLIYSSAAMHRIVEQIKKIRTSDVTVLITGESGTGKELVARALHSESERRDKPFVAFNCTAAPRDLLESHLFGHRRGSFTGATSDYNGIFRSAKGGTLFLDEIGDFSLEAQPKLLRFLESGEIQPLGESRPAKIDVRVIAATNVDLAHAVARRSFREDLYYRLNIINIHIPPLRERREDIETLARHFMEIFSKRYGNRELQISDSAMETLVNYSWPGNARQLRNEIERIFVNPRKGDVVSSMDLSQDIRACFKPVLVPASANAASAAAPMKQASSSDPHKLRDVMRPLERDLVLASLEENLWNISHTAKALGMSRRGLRLKIQRLGIRNE